MSIYIEITEGANTKQFEKDIEIEMDKHIKHFEKELLKIRTGRAHPSMIEDLRVPAYGALMALKEVASVSAPDVGLLLVQPWDAALIPDIEKAIATSDLGVTPANDGNVIRIALPRMSSARRDELVKVLHQKLEQAKIAIRNLRRDIQGLIRDTEKAKKISADYSRRLQDSLQKTTDKFIETSDKVGSKKENEIRAI
jgi:ribosome recycling factor